MSSMNQRIFLPMLAFLFSLTVYAGPIEYKKEGIVLRYGISQHPGRVHSVYAENTTDDDVTLFFINEYDKSEVKRILNRRKRLVGKDIDITFNTISIVTSKNIARREFFRYVPQKVGDKSVGVKPKEKDSEKVKPELVRKEDNNAENVEQDLGRNDAVETLDVKIIDDFYRYLDERVPYYTLSALTDDSMTVVQHIENLQNWKDRNDYIHSRGINEFIGQMKDSLSWYGQQDSLLIAKFFAKHKQISETVRSAYADSMEVVLKERRAMREGLLQQLERAVNVEQPEEQSQALMNINWKTVGVCGGLFLLAIALFLWYRKVRRQQKGVVALPAPQETSPKKDDVGIVVLNTRTMVLRKQSLDDVIDNNGYLKVCSADFCADSAVRYMYFKDSCIRDIYNMYAEDLRNPENPKEDGCMVLGRWVFDEEAGQYDVSLEQIVLPGDDAEFGEYELRFGGIIKMRMSKELRKLRSETGLQYDLTCWVHSHPGLGVFFSNSDDNVHMQLKHVLHPNFLTALVIDILTPDQEMGIFTFRSDSTLNSKDDLTKMYSLETMYKWAVSSLRTSFKEEDHFNIQARVKTSVQECQAIYLSNGAIIDMGILAAESANGQVALAHGFSRQWDDRAEFVVANVDKSETVPDNELIGCFVVASHCSIPSVRKAIASYLDKVHFVLVYTASDGLLTSIPIVNQDLCNDEDCYGEHRLEDLKVWTRRKR